MALSTEYGDDFVRTTTDRIDVPTFGPVNPASGPANIDLTRFADALMKARRRNSNQMQSQAIIGPGPAPIARRQSGPGREGQMSQAFLDDHRKRMMLAEQEKARQELAPAPMRLSHVGTQLFETPDVNRMSAVQRRAFLPNNSAVTNEGFSLGEEANQDARLIQNRERPVPEPDDERADFFGHGTTNRRQQQNMMQARALGLR